ncbi:MAG TPA: hypothetical protein VFN23_02890, partial [Ktedonobacteraceae bacterium]|nr:hypothetical protein [Ktedonobacteraceae bacterium]
AKRPATATIGRDLWATKQTRGQGISGQLSYALTLPAGSTEDFIFIIAGSTRSSEDAMATFQQMRSESAALVDRQRRRYQQVIDRTALHCNDELMETAFGWAKVNLQMLERTVPGIGQGVAGGFPDYPWWFGKDTTYSTLPLVASGQFELALASLRNLARHSNANNNDGGIAHEILTQGHIHDNGHLVEVPLFVRACYHAYCWIGDRAFLQEQYDFCKHGLLDLVLDEHSPDGDVCATGKGLIESRELQSGKGFKTLDIAAYTYEALLNLSEMALAMGDVEILPALQAKASALRERVNADWWLPEEGLFGDIYASAEEIVASHRALRAEMPLWPGDLLELDRSDVLLDQFFAMYKGQPEMSAQQGPWLLKHMIAATPMETGLASPEHAVQALPRLESAEFCGPWGIYLNPDRQRVTMSLPNGLMAAAEARYQRVDQSLAFSHKIASTVAIRMPGGFSDNPPDEGSFVQAWSSYGIIWPVMHYFFGFRPRAAEGKLWFAPHLPSSWQQARLENVRVGSANMTLDILRTNQAACIVLVTDDPSYEVTLGLITPEASNVQSVTFNGVRVSVSHACPDEFGSLYENSVWVPTTSGLQRYELRIVWE